MKLHLTEIINMGYLLTTNGIKSDPEKVQGLKDMPEPTEVKRFLGTANYLAKFIPNLSSTAEKLRDTGKKQKRRESSSSERKRGSLQ